MFMSIVSPRAEITSHTDTRDEHKSRSIRPRNFVFFYILRISVGSGGLCMYGGVCFGGSVEQGSDHRRKHLCCRWSLSQQKDSSELGHLISRIKSMLNLITKLISIVKISRSQTSLLAGILLKSYREWFILSGFHVQCSYSP
jgi:hypothetical protein